MYVDDLKELLDHIDDTTSDPNDPDAQQRKLTREWARIQRESEIDG